MTDLSILEGWCIVVYCPVLPPLGDARERDARTHLIQLHKLHERRAKELLLQKGVESTKQREQADQRAQSALMHKFFGLSTGDDTIGRAVAVTETAGPLLTSFERDLLRRLSSPSPVLEFTVSDGFDHLSSWESSIPGILKHEAELSSIRLVYCYLCSRRHTTTSLIHNIFLHCYIDTCTHQGHARMCTPQQPSLRIQGPR